MTDAVPPSRPVMEARCEEVGKMAVCLFYLSRQASAANMPEIAKVINQSITSVVALGVKNYQEFLRDVIAKNSNDESVFIETFCKVNDEAIRYDFREIFHQQNAGMK